MRHMETLHSERLVVRPAKDEDLARMLEIIQAPGAVEWWGDYEGPDDDAELLGGYAIVLDGEVIGWLGFDEEKMRKYRSVGFDIMIDPAHHGNGYGPEALRAVIDHFAESGHHYFHIDPNAKNERAIRAYEKVGFKPVGVMRKAEQLREGEGWHDSLLMDLLAEELD